MRFLNKSFAKKRLSSDSRFFIILGNERIIRKLVREGDPLVDRVISWAENVKKMLSGKGEKFTLAEKRRMDKALKAAEAGGNRINVEALSTIEKILGNAVLFDTVVSNPDKN